jgi:mono/diheme cytochrome c family protein
VSAKRLLLALPVLALTGCSWFTDFKQQPKIDPWETANDSTPFRGNPQMSVPTVGASAPGFLYDRAPSPQAIATMDNIANPIPADSASVSRGRVNYQINCAVCHGPSGAGLGVTSKYGVFAPPIGTPNSPPAGYTDGHIFAIIRNGKVTMPSYNRIEEPDRWDIVNYLRSLQGKIPIPADTTHCRPGETGACVPGATHFGPTRPAPYFHVTPVNANAAPAVTAPDTSKKKPESRP